ncbi:MAG: TIGR02147 family protein [Deltaproteobacteria bacterium]|nr:TIGR02147 family protein [Deltaproteobacteria bacterium]
MPGASTIYGYLDFRRFLADWFEAKKASNPRYSHRLFARKAGHKNPSLLLLVAQGKRNLSPANVQGFVRAMGLSAEESRFFGHLVDLGQASTADEQNEAWQHISASRRFREARSLEGKGFEVISRWYHSALHELARRDDFEADPAWIARSLRPRITRTQAKSALDLLFSLGMLAQTDTGATHPVDVSLATPHEVAGLAARNYHDGMLDLARGSITGSTREERHLCAVTACIPRALVPVLKREFDAFQERILDLCDGADGDREQVYQAHFALFPLSEPPLDPGASS